jgi:phage tail tape-measure protein
MGNFEQDQEEYLRLFRKLYSDGQFLDWAELLMKVSPDLAVAHLSTPVFAGVGAGAGAVAGVLVGAIFGPVGMIVGAGVGAGAGCAAGISLGERFDEWYRSASTEDRERIRSLGLKTTKAGTVVYGAVKTGTKVARALA